MKSIERLLLVIFLLIGCTFILFILILLLTNADVTQAMAAVFFGIAALVASFQNEIKALWKKPEFVIVCGKQSPFVVTKDNATYHRVKVKNRGLATAEGCYARLNGVISVSDGKTVISDPINLKWASAPEEINLRAYRETVKIPQKGSDFFDLVEIIESYQSHPVNRYEIGSPGSKGEKRNILFADQGYVFLITLFSDNAEPLHVDIWLHIDGSTHEIWAENISNKNMVFDTTKND